MLWQPQRICESGCDSDKQSNGCYVRAVKQFRNTNLTSSGTDLLVRPFLAIALDAE